MGSVERGQAAVVIDVAELVDRFDADICADGLVREDALDDGYVEDSDLAVAVNVAALACGLGNDHRDTDLIPGELGGAGSVGKVLAALLTLEVTQPTIGSLGRVSLGNILHRMSEHIDGLRCAGEFRAAGGAVYDLFIRAFCSTGSGIDVLLNGIARSMNVVELRDDQPFVSRLDGAVGILEARVADGALIMRLRAGSVLGSGNFGNRSQGMGDDRILTGNTADLIAALGAIGNYIKSSLVMSDVFILMNRIAGGMIAGSGIYYVVLAQIVELVPTYGTFYDLVMLAVLAAGSGSNVHELGIAGGMITGSGIYYVVLAQIVELFLTHGAVYDRVMLACLAAGSGGDILVHGIAGSMIGKLMILGLTGELFTAPGAVDDLFIATLYGAGRVMIVLDHRLARSMGMRRSDLAGERRLLGIPCGLNAGSRDRIINLLLGQAEAGADIIDHLLLGLLACFYDKVISVLVFSGLGGIVNNRQKVVEQRLVGGAFLEAGTDNITDRGDLLYGTDNGSVHVVPVSSESLLGAVYRVLDHSTIAVSDMTEAVNGKEQVISLVAPVLALGADKDDLVLYAGVEGLTVLGGIVFEYAGQTRCSGADLLA